MGGAKVRLSTPPDAHASLALGVFSTTPRPIQRATPFTRSSTLFNTGSLSLLLSLIIVITLISPEFFSSITIAEAEPQSGEASPGSDAAAAMAGPGAVLAALVIELPRALAGVADDAGDSADARPPPLVVEMHTATWCAPCREAEREVAVLTSTWPAVAVLAHHSSDPVLDELSTPASREARQRLGAVAFPTIALNGIWALNGSTQSLDLSLLVGNVTVNDGLLNSPSRLDRLSLVSDGWQWNATERDLTVGWSLVGAEANSTDLSGATVEAYLVRDGIDGGRLGFLPDVIVAGSAQNLTANGSVNPADDSTNSSSALVVDASNATSRTGLGGQRIVLVLRAAGVALRPGSLTPLFGQQAAPPPIAEVETLTDRYPLLPLFALLGGVLLMVPALRYTLPILFERTVRPLPYGGSDDSSDSEE